MKFLSSRVLRNQPGVVRDLAGDDDLVLTANGKPFAILVGIAEDDFEQTALAVSRMRKTAARRGVDRLSPSAINAEIRAARAARSQR
jgi:antitoxin (DNA-binding transcriptional repressor) of toxin-antitoxin stability system